MDPILQELLDSEELKSINTKQGLIDYLKEKRAEILGTEDQPGKPDDYFTKPEWESYDPKTLSNMIDARKCMIGQHIDSLVSELENKNKEKLEQLEKDRKDLENQIGVIREIESNPNPDLSKFGYKIFDGGYVPDSFNPPPSSVPEFEGDFLWDNHRYWDKLPNERIDKTKDGVKVEVKIYTCPTNQINGLTFFGNGRYSYKKFSGDEIIERNQKNIDDIDEEIKKIKEEKIADPAKFLEESFIKNKECMGAIEMPREQHFSIPIHLISKFKKSEGIDFC